MTKKNPYQVFPNYVLRSPIYSLSQYIKNTTEEEISEEVMVKICTSPIFKEAVFLATPSLYEEIEKWLQIENKNDIEFIKLKNSILKYFSRMSSRCTPFGLFSGCSVGTLSEKTLFEKNKKIKNSRKTTLDMNYILSLSVDLAKIPKIKKQLLFYPNSSIYRIGNQYRYVEYYYSDNKREHCISAVEYNEYLELIVLNSENGIILNDLIEILVKEGILVKQAEDFINDLVSNQFLISELEPSVSGEDLFSQLFFCLKKLNGIDNILNIIKNIENSLLQLDKAIINEPKRYYDLIDDFEKLGTDFDFKYLFQTDLNVCLNKNTINDSLILDIKKGIDFFNRITPNYENKNLLEFKEKFRARYDTKEVPLAVALDNEIGIGYKNDLISGDINYLVDDVILSSKKNKTIKGYDVKWNEFLSILQKKLDKGYKNNLYVISITENDFSDFKVNWEDIPDTFSCIIKIVEIEKKSKIVFKICGGASATKLLGRFCHSNKEINELVEDIIKVESKINSNKILAEILHLPDSRVGNVLLRPSFRDYEIPYLSRSCKPNDKQLLINDLLISINNSNDIVLRSKKYDKEVIPYLSNAHYYPNNSLPIYHFLCDLSSQNKRASIGFNFGPFSKDHEFLPRVEFNNLIVHEATWNLSNKDVLLLLSSMDDNEELIKATKTFREYHRMPKLILLAEGDNELLINLENLTSIRMFLNTIKNKINFVVIEFLFSEKELIMNSKECFTNEIIFSFFNGEKLVSSED